MRRLALTDLFSDRAIGRTKMRKTIGARGRLPCEAQWECQESDDEARIPTQCKLILKNKGRVMMH